MRLTKTFVFLHNFSNFWRILLFILKYMYISLLLKMINGFSWPAKIMASPFKCKFIVSMKARWLLRSSTFINELIYLCYFLYTGNGRMVSIRDTILKSLNTEAPDYVGIRENIGRYLHLLHSFYSNTNWVELYPKEINPDLGTFSSLFFIFL